MLLRRPLLLVLSRFPDHYFAQARVQHFLKPGGRSPQTRTYVWEQFCRKRKIKPALEPCGYGRHVSMLASDAALDDSSNVEMIHNFMSSLANR